MENIIYSHTGVKHGQGSDRYRWVSGLTKGEREAVKAGKTVIIDGAPTHGGNLPVRKVIYIKASGRFDCRCIWNNELAIAALEHFGYNPADFGF